MLLERRGRAAEPAERPSFHEFFRQAWDVIEGAPLIDNWHIAALCEHLQAVTAGQIKNLLINIPPGCSKSLTTCVLWPAWEWAADASVRFFFASYDQRLSTRDSVKCRALLASPWYQERWGGCFTLKDDQNQKTYFENDHGGYRLATSVGGHGTGEHPDRIIVDDPHPVKGAESEAERQSVLEWWDLTMSTRGVSRNVRRVVIMQRLHTNDLAGHVLEQGGWEHLCLPMRHEPGRMKATSLGWTDPRAEEGDLLTSGQFPEPTVAEMERNLGSYGAAAQLQQRPVPKGGGLFQADWLRWYRPDGVYFCLIRPETGLTDNIHWQDCRFFVTADLATSLKQEADYTVIAVWADDRQGRLILVDLYRGRCQGPDILPKVKAAMQAWSCQFVVIESYGMQLAFVQSAVRAGLAAREYKEKGDKADKAVPATIRMENGTVFLPDPKIRPWAADVKKELLSFPRGEHDDCVDVLSMAAHTMNKLYERANATPPTVLHAVGAHNPYSSVG